MAEHLVLRTVLQRCRACETAAPEIHRELTEETLPRGRLAETRSARIFVTCRKLWA